jgi:hypothetical protein
MMKFEAKVLRKYVKSEFPSVRQPTLQKDEEKAIIVEKMTVSKSDGGPMEVPKSLSAVSD